MIENSTIKIKTVADYINEISKLDYPKYKLFRGENQDYRETKLCSKIGRINKLKESGDDFMFIVPPNSVNRINSQSGVFCFTQDPSIGYQNYEFVFMIPGKHKYEIKSLLYKLNIHMESIFQDLDNLCKSLNFRKFDYDL